MGKALNDLGMQCASIIPDLFAEQVYGRGSYSSADRAVRRHAIDYTKAMCGVAQELCCPLLNLWPGQDGYDYLLCPGLRCRTGVDVRGHRGNSRSLIPISGFAPWCTNLKEPRTHGALARMADTLLLAEETGCPNVGVTIDTGHAFLAGEVVAESVVLAKRAGNRLFHMHFNDNHLTTGDVQHDRGHGAHRVLSRDPLLA